MEARRGSCSKNLLQPLDTLHNLSEAISAPSTPTTPYTAATSSASSPMKSPQLTTLHAEQTRKTSLRARRNASLSIKITPPVSPSSVLCEEPPSSTTCQVNKSKIKCKGLSILTSHNSAGGETVSNKCKRLDGSPKPKPVINTTSWVQQQYSPTSAPLLTSENDKYIPTFDHILPCIYPEPLKIMDGLFLGSEANSKDRKKLKELGITSILSIGQELGHPHGLADDAEPSSPSKVKAGSPRKALKLLYDDNSNINATVREGRDRFLINKLDSEACRKVLLALDNVTCHSNPDTPNALIRTTSFKYGSRTKMVKRTSLPSYTTQLSPKLGKLAISPSLLPPSLPTAIETAGPGSPYQRLYLPWSHDEDNIVDSFPAAFKFIDETIESRQAVLVHCLQGLSRSVTVVIAYIMYKTRAKLEDIYQTLKLRQPLISPHMGLWLQLREYENILQTSQEQDLYKTDENVVFSTLRRYDTGSPIPSPPTDILRTPTSATPSI